MNRLPTITYLLRLDDACPSMNHRNWNYIEGILDSQNIKPMVGIIPNNQDASLLYDEYDTNFVKNLKEWEKKGWSLAMHGYDHRYCSMKGGINPVHNRSEFAGVALEKQKEKIGMGIKYFRDSDFHIDYFFAPSHTFDQNTIEALKTESNIRIISDTIAFNPYKKYGIIFIPQQFGRFRVINIPGIWTFCYHPNVMDDNTIVQFSDFIKKHKQRFVSFGELDLTKVKNITLKDILYQKIYFMFRKIKYRNS
jgi:predicted deacetylase